METSAFLMAETLSFASLLLAQYPFKNPTPSGATVRGPATGYRWSGLSCYGFPGGIFQ